MTGNQHGLRPKTIRGILRRKFDAFLGSITNERVRELVSRDGIVTGGAIASMLLGEQVKDFDIYFATKETTIAVANYYVHLFKQNPPPRFSDGKEVPPIHVAVEDDQVEEVGLDGESKDRTGRTIPGRVRIVIKSVGIASEQGDTGYQYFEGDQDPDALDATAYVDTAMQVAEDTDDQAPEKPSYRPVFLTSNAITLSDKVQLVIRFYGAPEDIHENYDFVHCTNYWTSCDGKLVLHPAALECLLSRELRYNGSRYPVCSLFRLRKFIERGWSVNAGQILKMAMQVSQLDLEDANVLEDQLIGVDAAYFTEIVNKLREKFPDGHVPSAYLLEIIDRMF